MSKYGIKLKTQIPIHKLMNTCFFIKKQKRYNVKNESIFRKWCWHNWVSTCKRMKINPYLSSCTKLKYKWIKDLKIESTTLTLIEEKMENSLQCMGTGDQFKHITPGAQTIRTTMNKWELPKLRGFCKAKDTVIKTKRQPLSGRRSSPTPHQTKV